MTTTDTLTVTFDTAAARTSSNPGWRDAAETFSGSNDSSFEADTEALIHLAHQAGLITGPQPLLWISDDMDGAGAVVTVDLPNGLRLASTFQESRHWLSDRDAEGMDAAIDAVSRLVEVAAGMLAVYHRTTVTAPAHRKTWPDSDPERAAFADWQREVGDGDTVLGFRDWLDTRASDDE